MNITPCPNFNHRETNAPVRFCPNCGKVVNARIPAKRCREQSHAEARVDRSKYCVDSSVAAWNRRILVDVGDPLANRRVAPRANLPAKGTTHGLADPALKLCHVPVMCFFVIQRLPYESTRHSVISGSPQSTQNLLLSIRRLEWDVILHYGGSIVGRLLRSRMIGN